MAVYVSTQPPASPRSFLVFIEPNFEGEAHEKSVSEKPMPLSRIPTMELPSTSISQSCSCEDEGIASSVPGPGPSSSTTQAYDGTENAPQTSTACTVLGIAAEDCGVTTISLPVLQGIWKKAEKLVQCKGDILKVPWSSDEKSRLVKSTSSEHPHIVKVNSRSLQQYVCDDKCPMFKSYSLCSHVVAVAHDN